MVKPLKTTIYQQREKVDEENKDSEVETSAMEESEVAAVDLLEGGLGEEDDEDDDEEVEVLDVGEVTEEDDEEEEEAEEQSIASATSVTSEMSVNPDMDPAKP